MAQWPGDTPADWIDDIGHAIAERYRRIEEALEATLRRLVEQHLEVPDDVVARYWAIRELREQAESLVKQVDPAVMAQWATAEAAHGASAEIARTLLSFPAYAAMGVAQVTSLTAGGSYAVAAVELDLRDHLRALNARILRAPVDAYQAMTAKHVGSMLTGMTTSQALHTRILDQYIADGITGFIDKGGRRWTIGAYAEMSTRTAAARAWRDQSIASMKAAGITTYTPVVGNDGCSKCAAWIGKIVIDGGPTGAITVAHAITGEPVVIVVDGTIQQAQASGWGHPNCFPGFVPVRSETGIKSADSRWYEGELVIINTSAGTELSVTPNHPVLTSHGWVAAGALVEGDDLFSYHGGVETNPALKPGPNHVRQETPIGEVFETLRESGEVSSVLMPGSAEQFHGDGFDSEVNVVLANSLLGHDGKPLGFEELTEIELLLRRVRERALFAKRAPFEVVNSSHHAADCIVRAACEPATFLRRHLAHTEPVGFTLSSLSSASPLNGKDDRGASSTVVPYELGNGSTGLVLDSHLGITDREPALTHVETGSAHLSAELTLVDSDGGRDLVKGLTGLVSTMSIVKIEREHFAGHVYNLETSGGWYTANSIVVHNCRCVWVAGVPGGPDPAAHSTWDKQKERDRDELRRLEREVRQAKRDGDPGAIGEAQATLRAHVRDTGITRRPYREQLPFADGGTKNPRGNHKPTPVPKPPQGKVTVPDGAHVEPHEFATAQRLTQLGYNVAFNPVVNAPGVKNPDVTINGWLWEFKSPRGDGKNTIAHQFSRARKQSERLVLDMSRSPLNDAESLAEATRRLYADSTIRELIFIGKDGIPIHLKH